MKRTVAVGAAVSVAFAVLAAWSAAWSPLARRPLLDGLGPLLPYRWVAPPPEVTSDQAPAGGSFALPVRDGRSAYRTVFTADKQVTLIFDRGAIAQPPEPVVRVLVTPLDPANLGPLPTGLDAFGNAIRVRAGDALRFDAPVAAVLLYPETTTLHALSHELLWSPDGKAWTPLKTTESLTQQQVQAVMPGPGYVVAAGIPKELPSAVAATSGGRSALESIVWAVLVASALVLLGSLLRTRRLRE
jgi:hypothetical protein